MPRYVAFLRAINVGGHAVVSMADLRAQFEALGFAKVETFIASGNVIFEVRSGSAESLEKKIEAALARSFGHPVDTFNRTVAEVAAIANHRPFPAAAMARAAALSVGFLKRPLDAKTTRAAMEFRNAVDDFHVRGREVYWLCASRQSQSKFNNVRFERALGVRATWRGLNTVRKLAAKYPPG
jgi:uncharacterized protein (DUF1697 family)